jgi:hypothetical protein
VIDAECSMPQLITMMVADRSGRHSQSVTGVGFGMEQLPEAGTQLAADDGAVDLERETGTASG